jgi:hypothetical protein
MKTLKSKLLKLPRDKAKTIDVSPEQMDKKNKESQEKINRKRKERKLKDKLNNKFQLKKLKNKNRLLLREKEEEEEVDKVNSDLFNSKFHTNSLYN